LTVALKVSFTDLKAEINILDTLQFLFVAHMSKALPAIGTRIVIDPTPHYINERQSDLRGVKEGWYAIDERGILFSGPFSNQESCLTRISQSVKWSSALETRRPLRRISKPIRRMS
jgi:hypothetical protein